MLFSSVWSAIIAEADGPLAESATPRTKLMTKSSGSVATAYSRLTAVRMVSEATKTFFFPYLSASDPKTGRNSNGTMFCIRTRAITDVMSRPKTNSAYSGTAVLIRPLEMRDRNASAINARTTALNAPRPFSLTSGMTVGSATSLDGVVGAGATTIGAGGNQLGR